MHYLQTLLNNFNLYWYLLFLDLFDHFYDISLPNILIDSNIREEQVPDILQHIRHSEEVTYRLLEANVLHGLNMPLLIYDHL